MADATERHALATRARSLMHATRELQLDTARLVGRDPSRLAATAAVALADLADALTAATPPRGRVPAGHLLMAGHEPERCGWCAPGGADRG